MDTVNVQGRIYKKAALAAKELGYTTDYVGQLCRGKKINARLVGRSWYVDPQSLTQHQATKQAIKRAPVIQRQRTTQEPETKLSERSNHTENYVAHRSVEPFLTKNTLKAVRVTSSEPIRKLTTVRYESDDYALLPKIRGHQVARSLPIEPASATKVSVASANHSESRLTPSALPEVALSGALAVADVEDTNDLENSSDKRDNSKKKAENDLHIKVVGGKSKTVKLKKLDVATNISTKSRDHSDFTKAPSLVGDKKQTIPVSNIDLQTEAVSVPIFWQAFPVLAVLLAFVITGLLLGAEVKVIATEMARFSGMDFHVASLFKVLNFYTQ